jgi:general secretion pathway protein A
VHCVHWHNPALTRDEFIELLSVRFGLSERARESKATFLIELEHLLRRRHDSGETTVLIIDEAQSLPLELIEEIRLLANIETETDKLLTVIIAGQPELAERLNDVRLRQLKQRIVLRCELKPLTVQETAAYIAGRVRAAGGAAAQVFTRDAVTLIHERAKGVPRTINVLADNALLAGFATGRRPVGAQVVAEVCRDFDFGDAPGVQADSVQPAIAAAVAGPRADLLVRATPAIRPGNRILFDVADDETSNQSATPGAVKPRHWLFSLLSN